MGRLGYAGVGCLLTTATDLLRFATAFDKQSDQYSLGIKLVAGF